MVGFRGDDVRRVDEVPRVAERHRSGATCVWFPPSRRKLLKGKPSEVSADILDISVAGALLRSGENDRIRIGMRVRFRLEGADGLVEIRNVRRTSGDFSYYGVSFHNSSEELTSTIFDVVAATRDNDDERHSVF